MLTGLIAREYTGPGVVISWLIAGFGCCFSAMSYAELSCRIPSAGSSYAYVYVALGEVSIHIMQSSVHFYSYEEIRQFIVPYLTITFMSLRSYCPIFLEISIIEYHEKYNAICFFSYIYI